MILGSSNSITPSDLLGFTRFLTGTLDNTSAFSDTNIIALLNLEYRSLQAKLLAALNYDWKENTVDGTGTGLINLVAADNSYVFPTDMIQIDRIEISYTGDVNTYVEATIVPLQGMHPAISNTLQNAAVMGSKSSPVIYIRNGSFYLDPIPDVSVTSGMKVWGQTLITDLAAASPSGAPVFAAAFHEILAYGAASVWAASNQIRTADRLLQTKMLKFKEMVDFYSTRNATQQPVMVAKYRSMR